MTFLLDTGMGLALYVLLAFGLAYICGKAIISRWIREQLADFSLGTLHPFLGLVEMVECPACFGFWIGLLAGGCRFTTFAGLPYLAQYQLALATAVITCSTNFIIAHFTGLMPKEN